MLQHQKQETTRKNCARSVELRQSTNLPRPHRAVESSKARQLGEARGVGTGLNIAKCSFSYYLIQILMHISDKLGYLESNYH